MIQRLKPSAPDLVVAVPGRHGRPLAAEGEEVHLSTYWRRRLRSGDVVAAPAPRAKQDAAAPSKPARSRAQETP